MANRNIEKAAQLARSSSTSTVNTTQNSPESVKLPRRFTSQIMPQTHLSSFRNYAV